MRRVKKILSVIVVILLIFFVINFYGLEVKLSKDGHFLELALPVELLSFDESRQVHIWVVELADMKEAECISTQTRRFFGGCYWGSKDELWLEGDVGIVLYRYENGAWKEYPVTGLDDGKVVLHCKEETKSMDLASVPRAIVKKLSTFEEIIDDGGLHDILLEKVPEIREYESYIREMSSGEAHLVIQTYEEVEMTVGDEGEKEKYYPIYIGEQWKDHRVNWEWFYIHEDLQQIYWYDVVEDTLFPLEEWRSTDKYREL